MKLSPPNPQRIEMTEARALTIGNHPRQKRQQNLDLAGRPYSEFWLLYNY
jgi:hypothetical protein